jgi:hypothetical protein
MFYLDLEFFPTPALRPSKTARKDPLPDLLGDVLELSPTRNRGTAKSSDPSSDAYLSGETNHPTDLTTVSVSSDWLSDTISFTDSSPKSHNPPGRTEKKAKQSKHIERPPADVHKRGRAKQQAERADTSANSPVPDSRRQQQPKAKSAASATAQKRPAKESKEAKPLQGKANPTASRAKAKKKKHEDDLFELSDVTDAEEESRPKKRKTKQSTPKEPQAFPVGKPQPASKRSAQNVSTTSQRSKPTRGSKKPAGGEVPCGKEIEEDVPTFPDAFSDADQGVGLDIDSNHDENTNASSKNNSGPNKGPRMTRPVSTVRETDVPQGCASPGLSEFPKTAFGESDLVPALPVAPKPQDIITVSSVSAKDDDAPARSTSPLFMEQAQQTAASDEPDIAITVRTGISSDQCLPVRVPVDHRPLFTPPSLQPHAIAKHASMPQTQAMRHSPPQGLREAFLSDEQQAPSPPPVPEPESSSAEERLSPEDVWKEAVDDSSPPVIMHRIVTVSSGL